MNKDFLSKNKYIVITISAVLCSVVIFFAFRYLTPFGAGVSYQFSSMLDRDKLSKIKGAEETSSFSPTQAGVLQIPQQTIRQNTVTFNLKLITKPIEGVWVNLRFKGNPKEIKIGVRGSEKEDYLYKPLYQQQLEQLKTQTTDNNLLFWQKQPIYSNLEQFVEKPPVDKITAAYFFNLGDLSQKKISSSSEKNMIIARTLRGSHTLFIRVDKKPFNIAIEKQDSNAYKGEDRLLIELYKADKQITKKEIPDDGISDVSNLKMKPQTEQIKIDNLEPGIYKLVLTDKSSGADIGITKVETNQSALVSGSPFYILDDRPATVWTNSKKITVTTWHDNSLQTVRLDNLYDLKINKRIENYEFNLNKPETADNTRELHQLDIPKNDLVINSDGYFAFSKDSFFDPEPIKTVDLSTVSDISTIDYIIANYQKAKKDGEWYTAQAYFDPKDIKVDGDKLYFSLESPELSSYGGEIVIDNLEVTVKKPGWIKAVSPTPKIEEENKAPNFFQKIINFFKNIFSKKEIVSKPVPEPSPTSEPTPTPDPKTVFTITVFNSGAGKGAAGKFADVLKDAGFTKAEATNAASFDLKNASVSYNSKDAKIEKKFIEEIVALLKKSYDTVKEDGQAKETGMVKVVLGENPKEVTPTLTKTPEASATPSVKPTP